VEIPEALDFACIPCSILTRIPVLSTIWLFSERLPPFSAAEMPLLVNQPAISHRRETPDICRNQNLPAGVK